MNSTGKETLKLENQLCFRLYNLSKSMNRLYAPVLKQLELTYPQYLVMLVLWDATEPLKVKSLGEKLDLDTGTLSPLLKRMEKLNLISRNRNKKDERSVEIKLTPHGQSLKLKAEHIPTQMFKVTKLSINELQNLNKMLDKLSENIG
ncbi:MAG: MarR family transcriptional regulator [Alteromonadaceae bacterium]|nr:MarR family transcriptional regulator [Alteromonadaceae bacterium]